MKLNKENILVDIYYHNSISKISVKIHQPKDKNLLVIMSKNDFSLVLNKLLNKKYKEGKIKKTLKGFLEVKEND